MSHSEVQVTDWMYSGLVEMSQAPFIQKEGTQGDSRSPDSCPLPQAQGKKPARRLPRSTNSFHGPQEAAHSHSHGVKPHSNRGHQKAECEDPSQERCLGEDTGLGLPPGSLGGSRV